MNGISKKINLTKTIIEKLSYAENGQIIIRDSKLPGFGVLIGKSKKTYIVEKRVNGRNIRKVIGDIRYYNTEYARERARVVLGKMAAGINPVDEQKEKQAKSVSLQEAYGTYIKTRNLRPATIRTNDFILDHGFKSWKQTPLSEISRDMVQKKFIFISENHGKYYANNCMRLLRCIFNFARPRYMTKDGQYLIQTNPVSVLSELKIWNKEFRRQTKIAEGDLAIWGQAVSSIVNQDRPDVAETVRDYLLFVLFTGARKSEAASLKWSEVSFKKKSILFVQTKNGNDLEIPMSSFLYNLLSRRKANTASIFVFPGSGNTGHLIEVKRHTKKIIADTGIKFTLHDLRRNFTTAANKLLPVYTAKRLINHTISSSDVTDGYVVLELDELREPMQRLTDYFLSLLHGSEYIKSVAAA